MFIQHQLFTAAAIGRPTSLGRGNIDPATLKLMFVYFEQVQDGEGTWRYVQNEESLVLNEHYRFDKRRGIIELLDCLFWQQEGLWRAADREEPLLYKGQVKRPQRIEFSYEHYAPQEVEESRYTDEIDMEAKTRLGYDVPKYTIEESRAVEAPFEWEGENGNSTLSTQE